MKSIKYIIGYVDFYESIMLHVVYHGDIIDSHNQVWPNKVAAYGKWSWDAKYPSKINTYGEEISDDAFFVIYAAIDDIMNP